MEADYEERLIFCNMLINGYEQDPTILSRILWTDEATYLRTGMANPHNEHYWAHENPLLAREGNITNKASNKIYLSSHARTYCTRFATLARAVNSLAGIISDFSPLLHILLYFHHHCGHFIDLKSNFEFLSYICISFNLIQCTCGN